MQNQDAWFERLKEITWDRGGVAYHQGVTVPLQGGGDGISNPSQDSPQ